MDIITHQAFAAMQELHGSLMARLAGVRAQGEELKSGELEEGHGR